MSDGITGSGRNEVWVHAIRDEALGNASYLVDVGDGVAISIDPRRDADDHSRLASEQGLRITAVLETHLHADFVSGARELAARSGAEVFAAGAARLGFPNHRLSPGEHVAFGSASVEVIATPGHTPEHVAYLVRRGTAQALFSGGSLIVGGAARTDLTGSERTRELARAQFASLRRLAVLPEETELYPTHGGGSFCSTGPGRSTSSTIAAERASNPLLSIEGQDAFIDRLLSEYGSYPRYFSHLRERNRSGAPLLDSFDALAELDPARVVEAVARGAWLIDGRPVGEWARAHAEGSVSIAVRPAFASWLGWVVPFGDPFVLMLDEDRLAEATRLARRIGYDRIEGWLPFDPWQAAGLPVSSVEVVSPRQAAERAGDGAVLLDVRQANEYAAGRLPGAIHIELGDIIAGKRPDANEVITYCGHGERSATAASLLQIRGKRVANLHGGASAWRAAGYPLERSA